MKASDIKQPQFIPSKHYSKEQRERIDEDKKFFGRLQETDDVEIQPKDFTKATDNDPDWIPDHGLVSIKNLKRKMEENKPIDKPFMIIDDKPLYGKGDAKKGLFVVDHEGRHRAYVARKLGINKILIDVYCVKHGRLGCSKCRHIDKKFITKLHSQFENKKDRKKTLQENFKYWQEQWKRSAKNEKKIEAIF